MALLGHYISGLNGNCLSMDQVILPKYSLTVLSEFFYIIPSVPYTQMTKINLDQAVISSFIQEKQLESMSMIR